MVGGKEERQLCIYTYECFETYGNMDRVVLWIANRLLSRIPRIRHSLDNAMADDLATCHERGLLIFAGLAFTLRLVKIGIASSRRAERPE